MNSSSSACDPNPCDAAWLEIEEQKRDTEDRQQAAEAAAVQAQHEAELAEERLAALGKIQAADDAWQAERADIESAAAVSCDEIRNCGDAVRRGVAGDRECLDLAYEGFEREVESRRVALAAAQEALDTALAESEGAALELKALQSVFQDYYGDFLGTMAAARDKVIEAAAMFDQERRKVCTFERSYVALRDAEGACEEFDRLTATCVPREMLGLLNAIAIRRREAHGCEIAAKVATRKRDEAKAHVDELTVDRVEGILLLFRACL